MVLWVIWMPRMRTLVLCGGASLRCGTRFISFHYYYYIAKDGVRWNRTLTDIMRRECGEKEADLYQNAINLLWMAVFLLGN